MTLTAQQLSDAIGTVLEGDPDIELHGIASPERAGAHDLIYVDSDKNLERAQASAALCAIAFGSSSIAGKTILRSTQPKLAFAKAAAQLLAPPTIARGVHPTAVIAPLAEISPTASVGPFAVVGDGVHIGADTQIGAHAVVAPGCWIGSHCRIHPRVTLYAGTRLGNRVEIHSGAVLGADGFGYAHGEGRYWKFPQAGTVEIGDDVEIGANSTIDRGSLDDTRIAEGVKIDNLVHIGHNCQIGSHTVIAALAGVSGSCTFGSNAVIGGQAGFGERCHLEDGAIIGGQSGVLGGKTVRTGQTVWGTPARALDKFKQQHAWQQRLPELAARIKELERKVEKSE
jgi:UDP-3-O-[3-hydroxymyristoyl] glucosamine N-acyltransferase